MKTAPREIIMSEQATEHSNLSSATVEANEFPDFTKEECQRYCHLMNVNFFIPRGMPVGQEALKMSMGFGLNQERMENFN